jgi:pantoate kinase
MADVLGFAQDLYDDAREDPSLVAEYRAERKALMEGIRNGTGTGDIISGTKNGASYTKRVGFSLDERLSALRIAINGLDCNVRPSNVGYTRFNC